RGRRGDHGARPGAGGAHPPGLRQRRGGRDPRHGRVPVSAAASAALDWLPPALLAQLPVLVVLLPLLAAPLAAMARGARWPWAVATAAAWLAFLSAAALLARVLDAGPLQYHVGGWEPPWGIALSVDAANGLVLLLVSAIAAVVLPYARSSVRHEVGEA